jgi:hypothetical protein
LFLCVSSPRGRSEGMTAPPGAALARELNSALSAMQCEHYSLDGAVQHPANRRLYEIARGFETGWQTMRASRAKAMREAQLYLEKDIVINGRVIEQTCQLPPDVRCTIAVRLAPELVP